MKSCAAPSILTASCRDWTVPWMSPVETISTIHDMIIRRIFVPLDPPTCCWTSSWEQGQGTAEFCILMTSGLEQEATSKLGVHVLIMKYEMLGRVWVRRNSQKEREQKASSQDLICGE